jgi:2-polyprenyl-6-methoxyphenol hydroxylase-like FAD-dependent oxidoreductase
VGTTMTEPPAQSTNGTDSVLIVGAGPVGCVLALELALHGVRSTVLERSVTPSRHPKMDYVSGRSMELLRRLGIAADIRACGVAEHHPATFLWTLGFDQPPVATWRHASVTELTERFRSLADGTAMVEAYQRVQGSLLESFLRRRVEEHPLVDLRSGLDVTTVLQLPDGGVVVEASDVGTGVVHRIPGRFLAACDGANSTVRRQLGIEHELLGEPTRHCSIYFRSADPVLRRHGRAFVTIAAAGLTLVSRDEADMWTASLLLPDWQPPADPMAEVQRRLGQRFVVDELLSVAEWTGALGLATTYRQGDVFLVGDAAHQFQPTGGYGANTGLGDAVDLGWKIAARLAGWGGEILLDSYEAERRPVAGFALEVSAALLDVWRRFGRLGRAKMPPERIAGYVAAQQFQQDNLGVHTDYRYEGSPVVCPTDGNPPPWHWAGVLPRPWPGGRAPSVRLGDGRELFDCFGPEFTLVDVTTDQLGRRLVQEAAERHTPMRHLPVDDHAVRAVWDRPLTLVRPDGHVAWVAPGADGSAELEPGIWGAVLDRVCGRSGQ